MCLRVEADLEKGFKEVSVKAQAKRDGAEGRQDPTHDGGKEPDVGLGKLVAGDELLSAVEHLFEAVEALEERDDVRLVRVLLGREPALVDSVVDRVVDPVVLDRKSVV